MKGVVLSGGTGSRLRPITFSMAKQLVPVANEPILHYGLRDMAAGGIEDVAIIISPETGSDIRNAVGDGRHLGLASVEYIVQDEPLGLAHALGCALPWVDGDDVLMYLGDNLVKLGVSSVIEDFRTHTPNCQILLTAVDNPSAFGVAELDESGAVKALTEKPQNPRSNLALVGVYLFDESINDAIASIKPSSRGELEITDAIQYLVSNDYAVRSSVVRGWWKDTGRKEDLLHANELVLEDLETSIDGDLVDCQTRGPIRVEAGARLVDCQVTGPAVIGKGVKMSRTIIGPNTSIGDDSRLADATVEYSIIMERSTISGWRLRNTLVGRGCRIGGVAPPGFVELTLGEKSEIDAE